MRPLGRTPGNAVERLLDLVVSSGFLIRSGVPLLTGSLLAVLGTDVVVALGAIVAGIIAGWFATTVIVLVAMSFSAEESGYGLAMGLSESDRPSLEYQFVTRLFVLVPPPVAIGGTLMSAQLLTSVSRPLIAGGVVALGLFVAIKSGFDFMRRSAENATQRANWLRDRDATAANDPEFAEQLGVEGGRVDGPYEEMRAGYFGAWETVKEARRSSGRPTWAPSGEPLERPRDRT
jgi:hypothetical protein